MRLHVSPLPRSTPLGRRATVLGLGLLFAGVNTGNNLFFLIFTVLAACEVVGSLAAGRVLRRTKADLAVPARGRVGTPLRVTLRLTNRARRMPLPALTWTVRTSDGKETEVSTPALEPGGTGSGTGRLVPSARGSLRMERVEARTDFPVGLARRVVRLEPGDDATLVVPCSLPSRTRTTGTRREDLRRLVRPKGPGEDPLEAREYRPEDDARGIDWKASARTDKILWRDRRGDPPQALRVWLDRSGRPGQEFERRVSRAAGAAAEALVRGEAVGFASDEWEVLPRSGPAQRRRILDYLALVQPREGGTR